MNQFPKHVLAIASFGCCLLTAVPVRSASVQMVSRSTWGANGVPSYVSMYIYVPDNRATNPPLVVACHSCGTPVSGYVNSITEIRAAADQNGFIIILPEATGRNCWDVGTTQSLTHDGGGDTEAIVQMVQYALSTYNGNASRVYAMGGSSGAMMTQALMAVYPDVFRAGSARAGVAAGCWADGFDATQQWSNNCAGGNTNKTAQQWGDQARGMYPGYMGHRPRIQLFHGTADATINYRNLAESIEEWTNVLGLGATPTSTAMKTTSVATYDQQFWKNDCGTTVLETWAGRNGPHSMAYEQADILAFFGLNTAGGTDPEPPCPGTGGMGGMGGMSGVSGSGGSGGAAGTSAGGTAGNAGGMGPIAGSGGVPAGGSGGSNSGVGGQAVGGGSSGVGGQAVGGAMIGTAGSPSGSGSGGTSSAGTSSAGSVGDAGAATNAADESEPAGCGCRLGESKSKGPYAAVALGLALLALRRRRAKPRTDSGGLS